VAAVQSEMAYEHRPRRGLTLLIGLGPRLIVNTRERKVPRERLVGATF
jgi:hypothetical protein